MIKKIVQKILFVLLTLFGMFNVYAEIVVRLFRGTKYSAIAYNIYYLIPIRAHGLVALFSFGLLIYLLSEVTKKKSIPKTILLIIYAVYVFLFFAMGYWYADI